MSDLDMWRVTVGSCESALHECTAGMLVMLLKPDNSSNIARGTYIRIKLGDRGETGAHRIRAGYWGREREEQKA